MKKDYRSILGLNTVKAFIIVLLSLAIVGVVTLVVLGAFQTANLVPASTLSAQTNNESIFINSSGDLLNTVTNVSGWTLGSVLEIINATSNTSIPTANYTISSDGYVTNATKTTYTTAKITYTYNYNSINRNNQDAIIANTSSGIVSFFSNSVTYFALLGVVVIILIISLVVVVVNRFGGSSGGGSEAPSL